MAIPLVPVNSAENWSHPTKAAAKHWLQHSGLTTPTNERAPPTPTAHYGGELGKLTTALKHIEGKVDRLLEDNDELKVANADLLARNATLQKNNDDLLHTLQTLSQSLNDVMRENRLLWGSFRTAEHSAREQRVVLRDLYDRIERFEDPRRPAAPAGWITGSSAWATEGA